MKIAIASGKGGTGKTSLATSLCALLAEQQEVVLVDMDVEEPNSGLFLDTEDHHTEVWDKMIPHWDEDRCSPCGLCQEVCNFNAVIQMLDEVIVFPELCHSCNACTALCPEDALPMKGVRMGTMTKSRRGRLTFIENRLDIGQEQAVPMISRSLDYLDEHTDGNQLIICDAPPGTSCPVIEVVREADLVILVAEPTPFGLHDLELSVETMELLGRPHAVVINREGIGDRGVEDYCSRKGLCVIARIPDSREAAEAYSEGKLLYSGHPGIRAEIEKVGDYILNFAKQQHT